MKKFTLVLDQKVALLDSGLLDVITDPSNPLILGKRGSFVRKDETICKLYVIDTNALFTELPTWHHHRFNEMCKAAREKGYHFLVVTNA